MITIASRPRAVSQKLLAASEAKLDSDHDKLGDVDHPRKAGKIVDTNSKSFDTTEVVSQKPFSREKPDGSMNSCKSVTIDMLDAQRQRLLIAEREDGTAEVGEDLRPRNSERGLRSEEAMERRRVQLFTKKKLSQGTDLCWLVGRPDIAQGAHYILAKAFLKQWALSTDNAVDFMRCSFDQRTQIMLSFKPKGSRSIDEAFSSFLQRLQQNAMAKGSIKGQEGAYGKDDTYEEDENRWEEQEEVYNTLDEAPNTPLDDEILDQFIKKWQLDYESARVLQELPREDTCIVLETFAPHGDENINETLISVVKAKLSKNTLYAEFVEQWGLSLEAKTFLYSLPKPVADQALADFSPGATPDASASFLCLCKRRLVKSQSTLDPMNEFAAKFSLNDEAVTCLRSLSPLVRAAVLTNFNPPSKVHVSKQFINFAQFRERATMAQSEPVLQFAANWRLSNESVELLRECPAATQHYVMEKFSPPPECNKKGDVNEMFRKYLRLSNVPLCSSFATIGKCSFGVSCELLHSEGDRIPSGDDCQFQHVANASRYHHDYFHSGYRDSRYHTEFAQTWKRQRFS